jgi:peptide/nickel transport system ATP-binding protein
MGETEPLLTMDRLSIEGRQRDSWIPIIKSVSLELHRGEVLGLIGESGAGKSTLGLAAMGYVRAGCRITEGEIRFNGQDLRRMPERRRRRLRGDRIAYVAQSAAASFNPAKRLIDQYCETPVLHGVKSRRQAEGEAIEIFRRMRLPDPETIGLRYPHQVSGGQLQRAMIGMAMACEPDLLIFDEPTTALDVTTQIEVLAAIRTVVEEFDTAAIYITHDLAVVAQMADRIKVLLRGEEVEEAATRAMLADPQQDYTKTLWAVRSLAAQKVERPKPQGEPALQVEAVSAAYGATPVLHDVSMEIAPGRTTAVVGESGSGKSTLARVITGLLPPTSGRIVIGGEPMPPAYDKRSTDQLRHAQMIYQMADTALNPRQRVRELVGRPAQLYLGLRGRKLEERVRALLDMIELEPDAYIDRFPGDLSGGQKQRIGIARALAADPKLVICDEVTSALDQIVAQGVLKLLGRLQEELGVAYLFITHDIEIVRAIADDVVVMQKGRVVESGPRQTFFAPPHHDYTEVLLSSVPEMDADWLTHRLAARGDRPRGD